MPKLESLAQMRSLVQALERDQFHPSSELDFGRAPSGHLYVAVTEPAGCPLAGLAGSVTRYVYTDNDLWEMQ